MKYSYVILICLLLVSVVCFAESEEDYRRYLQYHDAQIKKAESGIPQVIEKYASSMGCNFQIDPKNVIPYRINAKEGKGYVAIYSLDLGCTGGSAMSRNYFVYLQKGSNFDILVNPSYSNPNQTSSDFPAVITELFLKNRELWFNGLELLPTDGLCCPSKAVSGRVYFEAGSWKTKN